MQRRPTRFARHGSACVVAALFLFAAAPATQANESEFESAITEEDVSTGIAEPAFVRTDPDKKDPVRIWLGAYTIPSTDFGQVDLGLVQSELRVRVPLPVNDTLSLRVVGEFKPSFYDKSGGGLLFEDCPECSLPDELYSTGLSVDGGYLLNRDRYLVREDEQWAAIASLYTRARFESGAFEDSLSPGVSTGLAYQLPRQLRVAVAVRVERALDGDGVKIGPTGYFRWDFLPDWRLRLRGLGAQLEYRVLPGLTIFAAGFRTSDRFRLDGDSGPGSGRTFRDRRVVVGGGFTVKILRSLRLTGESGAVVQRRVSFKTRNDGTIDRNDAGESMPYFGLRLEVRP